MSKLTTARLLSLFFLAILLYTLLPLSLAQAAGADSSTPTSLTLQYSHTPLPLRSPALSSAMAITATKTYTIATDSDGDNQADPGDVLSYTIVISNDGGTTSTGVTLSDTLDANTELSGLVSVSPVALDNSYNTGTNPIVLTVADGPTDLLADDYLGQNPPVSGLNAFGGGSLGGSVTSNAPGSTVNFGTGGSLTVSANGSFTFTPAVGFQGVFSYFYRLQNPVGPSDGRVTIAVDAPPQVISTNPLSGATNVNASTNITITFSENVDVAAGGVTLGCPSAAGFAPALPLANVNPLILNPTLSLPGGVTCTVSLLSANITDSDTNDPPDNLDGDGDGLAGGNYVFTFGVAPEAVDDAYNASPHLTLTITPTTGVRANDNPTTVTITGFGPTLATANGTVPNGTNSITTNDGGTVILNGDGSFTYNPPPDTKNTSDEFFYTVTGGDTAQVTLNIQNQNLIWFVDTTAAAGGNGTQARPFNLLTGAGSFDTVASDNAGDFIFIADGSYTCGLTLLNTQTVVGDGSSSTLQAISGVTPVSGSSLPAFSGTDPTLNNPAGSCFTLGSGNIIRGLTVNDTTNGFAFSSGTGSIGTATVSETSLTGPGGLFNLTTGGTFNATFETLSSTSAVTAAINMANTGGTISHLNSSSISHASALSATINIDGGAPSLTYNGNVTKSAGGQFINVEDTAGATLALGGTLTQNNTAGSGIRAANNSGGTTLTFSGASKVLNTAGNTSVTLSGNTGATINFTNGGLDIDTTTATAVNISGGGTVNVNGASNTINSTSGTAFLNSGTGGSAAIDINAALTSATGRLIDVQNRTANTLALSGNLSNTGTGILAQNNTGGTINFSGSAKNLNTGGNTAVTLDNNDNTTINFSNGGLNIDTTSGIGFNAINGAGGINVTTGANPNTIDSTTGTALNISNTTIGANDVTFQRISANGAVNGIVLNNTGAVGGLTVTGSGNTTVGGDNSGGTIQNTTGFGILLTSTFDPSFTNMRVMNTTGHGVGGTDVTNFTYNYGRIDDSNSDGNATTEEANIGFYVNETNSTRNNLDGTVSIVGNQLTNAQFHGIDIFNFSGTINDITMSDNTITSATAAANSQGSGIRLIAFGSATTIANITGAEISGNDINNFPSGAGIMVQGGNAANAGVGIPHPTSPSGTYGVNAANPIAITNNIVSGQSAANRIGTQGVIAVVNGKGLGNFLISGNSVTHVFGTAIAVSSFGFANVTAILTSNTITANNAVGAQGIGAGTSQTWASSDTPTLNVSIGDGTVAGRNTISQTDGNGILVTARDATGRVNVSIKTNTVATPLSGIRPGIRVDAGNGVSVDDAVCLDISGNTSAGSGDPGTTQAPGIGLRKQGTVPTTHDFGIEGLPGGSTATPNVENYVNSLNPGSAGGGPTSGAVGGTLLISATSGFSSCSTAP